MEISLNTELATFDSPRALARAHGGQGFDQVVARNIDEQQEEKEEQSSTPGIGLPGSVSQQERQEMELLRNKAMQIASQAEGELSPDQEREIKAIQDRLSELGGMPMSENLTQAAKDTAKQNQTEKLMQGEAEDAREASADESRMTDGEDGGLNPGMQMLRRNALVTSIKGASAQGSLRMSGA
ncbi:MAG: hypothetical protein V3571_15755 [Pseudodesulfovibrio sp.]